MKKLIQKLIMPAVLLVSVNASAYDVDTHFYGTYTMARFAGIKHNVAVKLALGAQWMDESYISDPLSMIVLPATGIKKRRLLHFPGSPLANKLNPQEAMTRFAGLLKTDPSSGIELSTYTETEADHEFATELFTEGLMEGNLMKISAGLHTLQDSFSHAGTVAELGHAHFWHHPDRPYVDQASVEKYFAMARSVLKAMVAVRALLPESEIDYEIAFSDQGPNAKLDGAALGELFHSNQLIHKYVSRKILNEPEFVDFALKNVFERAKKLGYVTDGVETYLKNYTPGQDAYQAAASISLALSEDRENFKKIVNQPMILKALGRPAETIDARYVVSLGGNEGLTTKVIHSLLSGLVPRPMNEYHRFEKEEDGPIWEKEMQIRVSNMRSLVYTIFGKDLYFVKNNTSDQVGYLLELTLDPKAKPVLPKSNGKTEMITYSLEEKHQFNKMIFGFLFPKLSATLGDLKAYSDMMRVFQSPPPAEKGVRAQIGNLWEKSKAAYDAFMSIDNYREKIKLAVEDLQTSRIVPNQYNRFYAVPYLLRSNISKGIFKPIKLQSTTKP